MRSLLPRRLLPRLALLFAGAAALCLFVTLALVGLVYNEADRPGSVFRAFLLKLDGMLAERIPDPPTAEAIAALERENRFTRIVLLDGRTVVAGRLERGEDLPDLYTRALPLPDGRRLAFRAGRQYIFHRRGGPVVAIVYTFETLHQTVVKFFRIVALVTLFVFLLLYLFVRRLLAPLAPLVAATEAIRRGELTYRIPPLHGAEFERLRTSFNAMAERLNALFDNQLLLLGNVSHDLKYYLTRLRMTAEVEVADADARASILEDVDGMLAITERALAACRAGADRAFERSRIDLSALTRERAAAHPGVAAKIADGVTATADAGRLALALDNLLANAQKHGHEPRLALSSAGGRFRLTVENATEAFYDAGALAMLTEPFHRGSAARERPADGSGLGLFIARAICEAHGFDLRLASDVGRFTATLEGPQAD